MPFLSTIEELALEKGQEIGEQKGAKETLQKNILSILEKRFGSLPEDLLKKVNQIDDLNCLEQLHLETISVNSISEFQQLISKKN